MINRFLDFLFGLRAPTSSSHTHLRLTLGISHPWLMIGVMLVVAALGWWSYRAQSASKRALIWMGILRAFTLLLVAFLFCRPMVVSENTLRTPSTVAVWVDSSLSMTLRDPYHSAAMRALLQRISVLTKSHRAGTTQAVSHHRPTRFQTACYSLQSPESNWLATLAREQHIAIFTGGRHARLLGQADNPVQLKSLLNRLAGQKPVATDTNVPQVVADILQRLQGRPISAVILLTDGRSTPGSSMQQARRMARATATPLFAVRLGEAHQPFNVALERVRAPRHAFVQDPVAVEAVLQITGDTQPLQAHVHLYKQNSDGTPGVELSNKIIAIKPGDGGVPIRMTFHPQSPGQYHLILRVDRIPGQITNRDNTISGISTDVIKSRIRVLFVDGYPRWEYRYLKNDLAREKTVLISCLLLSADNDFAQQGSLPINHFPETQSQMDRYDVLIFGDANPDYFSEKQQKIIVRFVARHGGGFAMIAGRRYAPDAYRNTRMAALLPVIADSRGNPALAPSTNYPIELHLTEAGRQSTLFQFFASQHKNLWQAEHLPPVYWYMPVLGIKPSAVVLANLPSRLINGRPAPLLVMGRYGAGRTLFSAICDTWRWRYYHGAPQYKSYWLEMVRLLARSRAFGRQQQLYLRVPANHVDVGASVPLTLHVDESLLPQMPNQVVLRSVSSASGSSEPLTLSRVKGEKGLFRGALTPLQTGSITISSPPGELPAVLAPVQLFAQTPDREFENLSADPAALRRLVAKTGGIVLNPAHVNRLSAMIPDRSLETIFRQSRQIWNKPIALALIVILLTVEWIVRKRVGLI